MISIVACCHGEKLCAYVARDFHRISTSSGMFGTSASTARITWEFLLNPLVWTRSEVWRRNSIFSSVAIWMCAYQWLVSNSKTSSHSGSPLFRTCRRSKTGPSVSSHIGITVPEVARRWKRNIRSCGVSIVAEHRSDRIALRASWSTSRHLSSDHPAVMQ